MYLSYKLAAFLTRCMVRNGSIEDNQYDAYLYCLDYLLELVVYFVTTFLFGLLLGYPLFGILYTLILFSLKSCCGGIHAPSRLLCTLFSYLCFLPHSACLVCVIRFPTQHGFSLHWPAAW